MSLVRNERTAYRATSISTVGAAAIAAGVIALIVVRWIVLVVPNWMLGADRTPVRRGAGRRLRP